MVATNYNAAIVWSNLKHFRASHKNRDCNKFVLWSNKRIKNIHFVLVTKYSYACLFYLQKQPLKGVPEERCFENFKEQQ